LKFHALTRHCRNQTGIQIPNTNSQIPNKSQISISNDQKPPLTPPSPQRGEGKGEGQLEFGPLKFICYLACLREAASA
jgi:hypothetical protein